MSGLKRAEAAGHTAPPLLDWFESALAIVRPPRHEIENNGGVHRAWSSLRAFLPAIRLVKARHAGFSSLMKAHAVTRGSRTS